MKVLSRFLFLFQQQLTPELLLLLLLVVAGLIPGRSKLKDFRLILRKSASPLSSDKQTAPSHSAPRSSRDPSESLRCSDFICRLFANFALSGNVVPLCSLSVERLLKQVDRLAQRKPLSSTCGAKVESFPPLCRAASLAGKHLKSINSLV